VDNRQDFLAKLHSPSDGSVDLIIAEGLGCFAEDQQAGIQEPLEVGHREFMGAWIGLGHGSPGQAFVPRTENTLETKADARGASKLVAEPPMFLFDGLAGEFSQHDFGQVDVRSLGEAAANVIG